VGEWGGGVSCKWCVLRVQARVLSSILPHGTNVIRNCAAPALLLGNRVGPGLP
jgi:hypothetical protein